MNTNLTPYLIIQKKRDKQKLSKEEIKWFIKGICAKTIPDYQISSLLMAIYLNGLSKQETADLTDAMLYSGTVFDFKDQLVIDKHSTGGVGDKTSFILAAVAAACGVRVPMIAGRGLGHTGGTVDKIESIDGFKTTITLKKFEQLLYKNNLVIIGQTATIAPADKILYALRDVTGTVESIPLITASIMSKKLAEGTSGIVMDIKTGPGAFMKTLKEARELAKSITDTGYRFNKNMMTFITDMSQPLGNCVGNSLEIIECIETLRGNGPDDLTELSLHLAGGMIYLAGVEKTLGKAIKRAQESISNGSALEKFKTLIKSQGGDSSFIDDYSKFKLAKIKTVIKAPKQGYINKIEAKDIGLLCLELGGGRKKVTDKIDFSVGFEFHKKVGTKVNKEDPLITIYHHKKQQKLVDTIIQKELTERVIKINTKKNELPLIYEIKTKWSKK